MQKMIHSKIGKVVVILDKDMVVAALTCVGFLSAAIRVSHKVARVLLIIVMFAALLYLLVDWQAVKLSIGNLAFLPSWFHF